MLFIGADSLLFLIEEGCDVLEEGCDVFKEGCNVLQEGCDVLDDGCDVLDDGCDVLDDGCDVLDDGCDVLAITGGALSIEPDWEAGSEDVLSIGPECVAFPLLLIAWVLFLIFTGPASLDFGLLVFLLNEISNLCLPHNMVPSNRSIAKDATALDLNVTKP